MIKDRSIDLDFVFCIDTTGNNSNVLEQLKSNISNFYRTIEDYYDECDQTVGEVRVKFIAFKDYAYDANPMDESQFFTFPEESEQALCFLNCLEVGYGGDIPENSLEALALAIKSDWKNTERRKRNYVVLCTDAPPHPLGKMEGYPNYPQGMPKDTDELMGWMEYGIEGYPFRPNSLRLLIFAPDCEQWGRFNEITRCYRVDVQESNGCNDVDFQTVMQWLFDMH